jgi:hypothetical protein
MPMTHPQLFGKTRSIQTRTKKGKSLRDILVSQGVPEEHLKGHLSFVSKCLLLNPTLDISRYRVNPNDPSQPMMG